MALFTSDDLLLYLYHETTPDQNAAIETALEADPALRAELDMLKEALPRNRKPLKPSAAAVNNILAYASGMPVKKRYQQRLHS